MRVKHTRSDMPKPILDAPMDEVLRVTLNSPPPKEWRYLKKRQAAIAKRKALGGAAKDSQFEEVNTGTSEC